MSSPVAQPQTGAVARSASSGLAEIVELILDKGLVIDAFVRVSLIGIEVLSIEARIVVASVDTYLRYAEAINQITAAGARQGGSPAIGQGTTADTKKAGETK